MSLSAWRHLSVPSKTQITLDVKWVRSKTWQCDNVVVMVWAGLGTTTTWLGLGKHRGLGSNCYFLKVIAAFSSLGYNNNHTVKVRERLWSRLTHRRKWETSSGLVWQNPTSCWPNHSFLTSTLHSLHNITQLHPLPLMDRKSPTATGGLCHMDINLLLFLGTWWNDLFSCEDGNIAVYTGCIIARTLLDLCLKLHLLSKQSYWVCLIQWVQMNLLLSFQEPITLADIICRDWYCLLVNYYFLGGDSHIHTDKTLYKIHIIQNIITNCQESLDCSWWNKQHMFTWQMHLAAVWIMTLVLGSKGGNQVMLLRSDEVCIGRRLVWIDESTKHWTFTWETAVHFLFPANSQCLFFLTMSAVIPYPCCIVTMTTKVS